MNNFASVGDIQAVILFGLIFAGAIVGGFVWVVAHVAAKVREVRDERDRENAKLWAEISRIQNAYVRQDHLDQRFTTIDGTLKEIREDIRALVRAMKPNAA